MSVSLSKGQRVDLTKGRPSLKNILVGLGRMMISFSMVILNIVQKV